MKISLHWLRRYLPIEESEESIAEALTLIGFEVEGIERLGLAPMERVVVGEVLTRDPHPNADRLSVSEVRVGPGESDVHHIVCGARNYQVGDRVLVALPGAELPGGFRIKKTKLRGEPSEGMMCSARELGLGDDHEGIQILPQRPAIGTGINEVFPDTDTIFDIEVTPNRPDCLSHIGIARELGAWFDLDFSYPDTGRVAVPTSGRGDLLEDVTVEAPENCPHYRAYGIRGVKVGPSPDWLRRAIESIGLRPINNVVDVTNFVLHELGQPLHAFDASKIGGRRIVVRQARDGESIVTLDDRKRKLHPRMTVIADAERPMVVAGVMGSLDAEVDESTRDIVLEAAYFNPGNIRWTSRRLGLSTDSSYRFERGVDPRGAEFAALRAIDLIAEVAGGKIAGPAIVAGEPSLVEREIVISPRFIRERLGFDAPAQRMEEVFRALEFEVSDTMDDRGDVQFRVGIPSFRMDLDRRVDLVEEFLRIHGTDKIPSVPVKSVALDREDDRSALFVRAAGSYLRGRHFDECVHYTMRSEAELNEWYTRAAASSLGLANPLASDQSHLRTSLVPGLLDAVRLNQHRRNDASRLFETGRVFREHEGAVYEMVSIAFVIVDSGLFDHWREQPKSDFYTVAGTVRNLLTLAGITLSPTAWVPLENDNPWRPGHAAWAGGFEELWEAKVGLLNPSVVKAWDIDGLVYSGTLYLRPELLEQPPARPRFRNFSAFPPTTKDLALVVDTTVSAGEVQLALEKAAHAAADGDVGVESVQPFDCYAGEGIEAGKKSLAFRIVFRSPERTLTDEAVNAVFGSIQENLEKETPYRVRR